MKKSHKILIPTLALTVASVAGLAGIGSVLADEDESGRHSSIISKLVEKFNLSEDEVRSVFDEERDERQAQMKANREEKLNTLVSEGKLTEEQKNALLAKWEEEQAERGTGRGEGFKDMTKEERDAEMEAHRTEMDEWLEAQGIDKSVLQELGPGMGMGGGGHHRGPGPGAGTGE
jgi:predicted GNAT family acetyltransferase